MRPEQIRAAMRRATRKFNAAIHRSNRKSARPDGDDFKAKRHCRTACRWHLEWNRLRDKLPTPPTNET